MLIGIVGKKQHGKSTAAAVLADMHGLEVDAFAAPIKAAAREWFGLTTHQVDGDQKQVIDPRWDRTPREIMQLLGTEVARTIHPDVWARAAIARHDKRMAHPLTGFRQFKGTVIADVRFLNEATLLREAGGVLIYVVRPGLADDEFSNHASETAVAAIGAGAHITVKNSGSLLQFKNVITAAFTADALAALL